MSSSIQLPEDVFKPHVSLERPENALKMKPSEARGLFRTNNYTGFTSGFCDEYTQFNILVISSSFADDFETFCNHNSGAFPVLYRSKPGEVGAPPLAMDSNIRTDLPCYTIWKNGVRIAETPDLSQFEPIWDDFVTFYIGCSSTFDSALLINGVEVPNVLDIPCYRSSISCSPVGPFQKVEMSVSMRTIAKHQLEKAIMISSQYPDYHGAPIHIGDPTRIGIDDVHVPDGYVATFWACGMTVNDVISAAKLELAFTHYPGAMFVADIKREPKSLSDPVKIVDLNKDGCEYFASIINQHSLVVFDGILSTLGHKEVESDALLKASLILSHANKVVLVYTPTSSPTSRQETIVLGIMIICQALLTLRKEVTLVVNEKDKKLFHVLSNYLAKVNTFQPDALKILPVTTITKESIPAFNCLLALTQDCQFTNSLFETAQKNSHSYIVKLDSTRGKADSEADCTIRTESVSSSAYALAGALYVASTSSYHWRYKNHAVNSDKPSQFSVNDFIPTDDQAHSLWKSLDVLPEQERSFIADINLSPLTKLYTMLTTL